jgi:drug/metabolite transporter (DMT)-like permease
VPPDWLWVPVTIWAAVAQTLRNAAQRSLTGTLGTLGATLVRFLYGLPFAALWLGIVRGVGGFALPVPTAGFAGWVVLGAVGQIVATALLLRVMAERNFALGVAYSKTEIVQVALLGLVLLGDPITPVTAAAIVLGTLGVQLIAPADRARPLAALLAGWTSRPAIAGLGSGASFALSAVGYRGAARALPGAPFLMAAAFTLVVAQAIQTALLGGWLVARDRALIGRVGRAWRASLLAGLMGAAASAGWFTAMAIEPVAHVRTLGLVELVFSTIVSWRVFRERLTPREVAGMALLVAGVVMVTLGR